MPPITRESTPSSAIVTSYVVTAVPVLPRGAIFSTVPSSVTSGSASSSITARCPASTETMSSSSMLSVSVMPAPSSTMESSFVPPETLSPLSASSVATRPSHGAVITSASCFLRSASSSACAFA